MTEDQIVTLEERAYLLTDWEFSTRYVEGYRVRYATVVRNIDFVGQLLRSVEYQFKLREALVSKEYSEVKGKDIKPGPLEVSKLILPE